MNEQELLQAQQELATKQEEFNKQKNTSSEILRKLSSEFKVNLFEAPEVEKFLNSVNERNSVLESYKTKETEWSKKTEELAKQVELYTQKEQDYQVTIEALGMGFKKDDLKEVMALAKVNTNEGQSILDGLKVVKDKYGKTFVTNIGMQHNDNNNPPKVLTDQEKYLKESKAVRDYEKQQSKLQK